ncbi:MAG: hypothetical protein KJ725_12135 [Gammaproteobacteria bacterium]|jgi:hypothetical protein|uniref:hypothetical protein n=1 Tax=Methylotuvimicrobium sp. TaxID=2822413 RepID=UPI001D59A524|nr:hypothetical protein [Gammaproteobacteria bacterium]
MKNFKFLFIIIGFIGLILFQREAIMPFVHKVASSDLFLVDSEDIGDLESISNEMTDLAFTFCNNYIKEELDNKYSVFFSAQPLNAWGIGNHQYVINAEVEIAGPETASITRRYACRIKYKKGDDKSGILNTDNWSVDGLSGIDEL